MKCLDKKEKHSRGFTLVETLVAITILLVAIVGPMTIAARGLQTAFFAREQITAFSLAQEGVELVRAMRDASALRGENWLTNIPPAVCNSTGGCGLDSRGTTLFLCGAPTATNCRLTYDTGSLSNRRGFYSYATGNPQTIYTRRIFVNETVFGKEAEVTVTVSWQSGLFAGIKTVTIQSRIFNQYNNP
jgi:prepilin-type N-terminal cleavage/methylation domain-containing protein